jgi:diaminohydroxyphosphoribosylaminopyrimidine deaminase / 5-amino-6-(5-phosphoribosylamino)uracil reductase
MPPIDLAWLERAFALAERGRYSSSPNPMVGAVVVRDGRVVGEASHRRAGEAHAEIRALARAGRRARGADLYLTLEPCVHQGRTPPCAPAVVASGVARVIVASTDPNPKVAGRGVSTLRREGVGVVLAPVGWRRRAAEQNERFRNWITTGRPFVLAKWAESLDGKIASASGQSQWITGEIARERAMRLREEYDAVLVGCGTVAADDPRLTRRLGLNRSTVHWRIVLDGRLRVSETAKVFRGGGRKVVVTAVHPSHPRVARLTARGIEVWSLPARGEKAAGRVDLARLLDELGQQEVTGLMVEGGAETLWSFFSEGLVDRVMVFLAPRILGGRDAPGSVAGPGFRLSTTPRLSDMRVEPLGEDICVTARREPKTEKREE